MFARCDVAFRFTVGDGVLDVPNFAMHAIFVRLDVPFHSTVGDSVLDVPNFAMHAIFVRLDVPFHFTVGDGVLDVPNFAMQAIFVRRDVPNPVGVSIRNDYQKSMIYCNPCLKYVKTYFRKQRWGMLNCYEFKKRNHDAS